MTYEEFLNSKKKRFTGDGFACDDSALPQNMFPWQKKIVGWATKKGRCALWADTGLGKTIMQLAWADQVVRYTGQSVLILTPLAVSAQTIKEALHFGLKAYIAHDRSDIRWPGIYVTNYQKLHRFDASVFSGVVLDESSILKSFQGKTKTLLTETFSQTPYRLACTATPAPNDHLELGNHSDFLGIMPQKEMLARWFLNDLMGNMSWRLKAHAHKDFWRWVASWAVCLRKPSDMGYPDDGYDLPPLNIQHISIPTDGIRIGGALFADASLSATTLHEVLRQTAPIRARKAAELVNGDPHDNWLVWTHTNYEADELIDVMPSDAIEVRGSDTNEYKEQAALWMAGLTVNRPLGIIGTCKQNISKNTTKKIERSESLKQPSGSETIGSTDVNTCANILSAIEIESMNYVGRLQMKEISGEESSTLATNQSGSNTVNTPKNGKRKTLKNDSHNALAHTGSRQTITGHYSKNKMEGVPSVGHPNAVIIPNVQKAASEGFMSITATQPGKFEDCSAQTATLDSESLGTHSSLSSEPSDTSQRRILISKSEIFGYGMNFQAISKMIFVGMDYSYEKFYQAVRRCYRYGQTKPVTAYCLATDMEWRLFDSLAKKQRAHEDMQSEMITLMKEESCWI